MAMELKIFSPKEDGFIKAIEFNHEELKTEIEAQLEKYQGLAYTDDTIQEARKDRATLNKFKKALDDKRKEIKGRCLEPFNAFEVRIRELVALVDKPMLAIDEQVKGYEERKKAEKRAEIEAFWNASESNVKTLVPLNRVFNPRWLNATFAMSRIEKEVSTFLSKVESELAIIEDLHTEFEDQTVRAYLHSFSMADALAENKKLLEQKAKREEYRRQQEEAAKARAEAIRNIPEQQTAQPEPQPAPKPEVRQPSPVQAAPEASPVEEPIHQLDFRVWGTAAQLADLKNFLRTRGIRYGHVPQERAA